MASRRQWLVLLGVGWGAGRGDGAAVVPCRSGLHGNAAGQQAHASALPATTYTAGPGCVLCSSRRRASLQPGCAGFGALSGGWGLASGPRPLQAPCTTAHPPFAKKALRRLQLGRSCRALHPVAAGITSSRETLCCWTSPACCTCCWRTAAACGSGPTATGCSMQATRKRCWQVR